MDTWFCEQTRIINFSGSQIQLWKKIKRVQSWFEEHDNQFGVLNWPQIPIQSVICDLCWEKKPKNTAGRTSGICCWPVGVRYHRTPSAVFRSVPGGVRAILATNNTTEMFCFIRLFIYIYILIIWWKSHEETKYYCVFRLSQREFMKGGVRPGWLTEAQDGDGIYWTSSFPLGVCPVHGWCVFFCSQVFHWQVPWLTEAPSWIIKVEILLVTAGVRKSAARSLRKWHQQSQQSPHVMFFFFKNDV